MSCGFLQTCIALAKHRDRVESDAKSNSKTRISLIHLFVNVLRGDSYGIILTELFETKSILSIKCKNEPNEI